MTSATCSMERDEAVLKMNGTPSLAAARAGPNSPSSANVPCTPIGARNIGDVLFFPRIVV